MKKLIIMTAVLGVCAVAGAQSVSPSVGTEADQVNKGTTSASVKQNVNLILPQATALHLTATNLDFDISKLGSQDGTWYCAYGLSATDQSSALTPKEEFWGQTQTLPLGTSYDVAEYPNIKVNAGKKVTSYPPVELVGGKVDNATKNYFVCYRTFVLQKFSNVGNYRLSVSRDNPTGDMGHQMLYIQEDPCNAWGQTTGLYKLDEGTSKILTPKSLTEGTTGKQVLAPSKDGRNVCRKGTSWLDDVVVVAVVVDGDKAGKNTAVLTYTLESSASVFTSN
ncbi:hypothetical protein [Deinococcus petrolearius]|uniref:Uncharacterized protein n=1 Tax=Deinococcus petrolearius TaxID=1751295 RepID=A0ABW1DJC8_9DEIO